MIARLLRWLRYGTTEEMSTLRPYEAEQQLRPQIKLDVTPSRKGL